MKIPITNVRLDSRSGATVVAGDMALDLLVAGHRPMDYSPILGEVAKGIDATGVPVRS